MRTMKNYGLKCDVTKEIWFTGSGNGEPWMDSKLLHAYKC